MKRAKAEALAFRVDLDSRLHALREQLLAGSVPWGPYRTFKVYDRRVIESIEGSCPKEARTA